MIRATDRCFARVRDRPASVQPLAALQTVNTRQQHGAYLLNWSSSDLVFYIAVKSAVGLCSEQTLRAD